MKLEFITILSLYIIIGSIIAFISRRHFTRNLRDYYTSSGRLRGVIAAGTYASTTYSAFMMLGLVGLTYATGVGAYGFELLYLIVTVFLLSTIGFKIWSMAKEKAWISPSQMIGDLYGSKTISMITALIYLFAMLPYLAAQIQGLRIVFRFGGLDDVSAIVISSILVYVWIVIAGMWSVALTDLYQGIVMLTSASIYLTWLLGFYIPSHGVDYSGLIEVLGSNGYLGIHDFWKPHVFLAYTLPWIFFAVTNPQVVVRLYLPKDEKSYRRSVLYFSLYGFLYTLIVCIIGLFAAGLTALNKIPAISPRDSVTPYLLGSMNPVMGSFIAVSIIAAAISTANSIVLAVSSSVVKDVLSRENLTTSRIIEAILVIMAALIALQNIAFIVELSVLTSVILLPLAPIIVLGVYKSNSIREKTRITSILALIVGVSIALIYSILYGPRSAFVQPIQGLPLSFWVIAISTIILVIGYLLDTKTT